MSDPSVELEQFLDALNTGSNPGSSKGDAAMHAAAQWLTTSTPRPTPDSDFARSLRASLLVNPQSLGPVVVLPDRPVLLTPSPAYRRRGWIVAEAAVLLLLIIPAFWFIAQQRASDDGPGAAGSRPSIAAPPETLDVLLTPPSAEVTSKTILMPTPEPGQWGGYTPTTTSRSDVVYEGSTPISEGSILKTTFDTELRAQPDRSSTVLQPLPTGTILYATGAANSTSGSTWLPVIEPSSGQAGWAPTAWLDTPIIDGRIVDQGTLATTVAVTSLYGAPIPASEPVATVGAGATLIVVQSYTEGGPFVWLAVIDPSESRLVWAEFDDLHYVESPNPIASPDPLEGVEIATTQEFAPGTIVRATEENALLAGSSIGAQASGHVRQGQQLLVTGDAVVAGNQTFIPVQIVPSGGAGWIWALHVEPIDPTEFVYPLGGQVVGRVELYLWDRLNVEDGAFSMWRRPEGTVLTVAGAPERYQDRDMLPVVDPATGMGGWVWLPLVTPANETALPPAATGALLATDAETYLRESHAPESPVLDVVTPDDALRVTHLWDAPDDVQWVAVERVSDGLVGWIPAEALRNSLVAASLAPSAGATFTTRWQSGQLAAGEQVTYTGRARIAQGNLELLVRVESTGEEAWMIDSNLAPSEATATATPTTTDVALAYSTTTDVVTALGVPPVLDSVVVKVGAVATPLYAQPSIESPVVGTALPDERYEIVGEILEIDRQVWIQVIDPETGGFAWIDAGMPSSRPYLMPISIELRMDGFLRSSADFGDNLIRPLESGAAFKPFGPSVTAGGLTWVTVLDQTTGQIGWIAAAAGSPFTWPVGTELRVDVSDLNLRSDTNFDATIVTTLHDGDLLTVTDIAVEADDAIWISVQTKDGQSGYVVADDAPNPNR